MLTLSPTTLSPLAVASFVLDLRYAQPSFPLQTIARRFTCPSLSAPAPDDTRAATFLLSNGIGQSSELWIPTIKHLFRLFNSPAGSPRLRAVWVVDCPNTGDATQLNWDVIQAQFAEFPTDVYGEAIRAFLDTPLLAPAERANLVGIGHSGGAGAIILSVPEDGPVPFSALVYVEPPFLPQDARAALRQRAELTRPYYAKRATAWPSVEDALAYMRTTAPWKRWDAAVMQVLAETGFRPEGAGVTTKTDVQAEIAGGRDVLSPFVASPRAIRFMRTVPTHVIMGERQDFWPKPVRNFISAIINENRPNLASVATVSKAGHYIPQDNPEGMAQAILKALSTPARALARL